MFLGEADLRIQVPQKVKKCIFQYFPYILGITGISSFEKINEEELTTILNDCHPDHKKIQPENPGKPQIGNAALINISKKEN